MEIDTGPVLSIPLYVNVMLFEDVVPPFCTGFPVPSIAEIICVSGDTVSVAVAVGKVGETAVGLIEYHNTDCVVSLFLYSQRFMALRVISNICRENIHNPPP